MQAMKDALKKKMNDGGALDIEIGGPKPMDSGMDIDAIAQLLGKHPDEIKQMIKEKGETPDPNEVTGEDGDADGMAPQGMAHEAPTDSMSAISAIADRTGGGNSLGSMAAAGAKSKIAEMMKHKK